MNPFRKIRRGRDVDDIPPASSPSTSSKKSNKNPSETTTTTTKFEFDLENALPSTDEFRTSLLMPKLSARFSMLREQDDPNTKVGKANDDSVLFPKRASRLNLFGHNSNPLSDIAEVSSVGDRPSLSLHRSSSFVSAEDGTTDDDQSRSGSIMSRKRPGEGNNLFGGRQKIYKIPIKDGDSDESGTGLRGRAVYEDDITLSAFQQFRLREKEQKRAEMALEGTLDTEGSPDTEDNTATLSTKRTTSSSTTSGRSHRPTSTAATSVDEQPVSGTAPSATNNSTSSPVKPAWAAIASERHVTKTRRLYDERLAQTVQDQQTSAVSRLESLRRQRAGAGTPEPPRLRRNVSRSAANLSDKPSRIQPVQAAPVYGGARASPSQQYPDSPDSEAVSPVSGQPLFHSPLGYHEDSSALAAALNPEDRGKATAMGLFNKPTGQFDEERFQRLQLQMHESRAQTQQRSPSNSVSKPAGLEGQTEVQSETQSGAQTIEGQPPNSSVTSTRSRAESASSHYSSNAPRSGPSSRSQSVAEASLGHPVGETMLHLTDSESEALDESFTRPPSSAGRPRVDGIHPAFRSRPASRDSSDTRPPSREQSGGVPDLKIPMQDLKLSDAPPSPIPEEVSEKTADSPTLGPSGPGLSGLIRSLRHTSYQSTIRPPSAGQSDGLRVDQPAVRESHPPASVHSSPFEYDDLDRSSLADSTATTTLESRDRESISLRDHRPDVRAGSRDGSVDTLGRRQYTHRREESTETQREREEFEYELAQRRRRVEETLHRIGESESRSQSPVRGASDIPSRPGSALAMFKNRAGKSNKDQSGIGAAPKGLKMLGLAGPAGPNGSTPSLHSTDSPRDGDSAPGLGLHVNTSSASVASSRKGSVPTPSTSNHPRGLEEEDHHRGDWPTGSSRSSKSFGSRFYRAESPSLTRRDYPSSTTGSARPSVEMAERSASAMSGTFRPNSRAADLHLHTDVSTIGSSPRPSPVAAYSANTTPPVHEPGHGTSSRRSSTTSGLPKRHVDKSQISEPTLVSSTSQVPIVDLPAGASLSNGMEPPPIPPMNPRRRRGTMTQQLKNMARGGQQSRPQSPGGETPTRTSVEERSVFEDDDGSSTKRSATRGKLRKLPSEGTSLHSRSRQHAAATAPAPAAVPPFGHSASVEGGMI
ncbi:hypothetical protein VTN31DRAFT_3162 [Thermomyces dupontii]|uniref:uncharacterized protein n=1 Tax=Talaromyces thermophilus TaxID=28565 RepID=UPI0037430BCF